MSAWSPTNLTNAKDGIMVRANMAAYSVVPSSTPMENRNGMGIGNEREQQYEECVCVCVCFLPSKNFRGWDFLMATALELVAVNREGRKANTAGKRNSKLTKNFMLICDMRRHRITLKLTQQTPHHNLVIREELPWYLLLFVSIIVKVCIIQFPIRVKI